MDNENLYAFPQSLQEILEKCIEIGHSCSLPQSYQLIIQYQPTTKTDITSTQVFLPLMNGRILH